MDRHQQPLRLYGRDSDQPPLDWAWVERQLIESPTYWVIARTDGHPHPRPVWGVWAGSRLHLSIGTPANLRALGADPRVTVHLESGTDVVIVQGAALAGDSSDAVALTEYNRKYDWDYDAARYGDLTRLEPSSVLAWRVGGPAGRDSFQATGRWAFGRSG